MAIIISRQEAFAKKEKLVKDEQEREAHYIEKQVKRDIKQLKRK